MTEQPLESSRNELFHSAESDIQLRDSSISISVATSVGNIQNPRKTSTDDITTDRNKALSRHPEVIAGTVSPADLTTPSDAEPNRGNQNFAEVFSAASAPTSVENIQHPGKASADIITMERNQASPRHSEDIAGAVSTVGSTTSLTAEPNRSSKHGAEVFTAAHAVVSPQGTDSIATQPVVAERLHSGMLFADGAEVNLSAAVDYSATSVLRETCIKSVSLGAIVESFKSGASEGHGAALSTEHFAEPRECRMDNLPVVGPIERKESSVNCAMATSEEEVSKGSHDGGMTRSSPQPDVLTKTEACFNSETARGVAKVIESQQIGGETLEALHPTPLIVEHEQVCHFQLPLNNTLSIGQTQTDTRLLDDSMVAGKDMLEGSHEFGGSTSNLPAPENTDTKANRLESVTADIVRNVFESEKIPIGKSTDMQNRTLVNAEQQQVQHVRPRIHHSPTAENTHGDEPLGNDTRATDKDVTNKAPEFEGSTSITQEQQCTETKVNKSMPESSVQVEKLPSLNPAILRWNPKDGKRTSMSELSPTFDQIPMPSDGISSDNSVPYETNMTISNTLTPSVLGIDAGEDSHAPIQGIHQLKRKRTKQTSKLHKHAEMPNSGVRSHNRLIEAKDSLSNLTDQRYYNLRSRTSIAGNVSRRRTNAARITNTITGTRKATKPPSKKVRTSSIKSSKATVTPVLIDRTRSQTKGTRTKTNTSGTHESIGQKAVDGASTTASDQMASSGEGTSGSNSSSSKHRRRHAQRSKRQGDRKRTNQLLLNESGIIHPVCVISKQLAEQFWDTSIVVQGYHRTRISLTNWTTSFCLINHIGSKIRRKATWCDESTERMEIGLTDLCDDDVFTVMCPVGDLDEDSVIELIRDKGGPVNKQSDYALLLVVAKVPQKTEGTGSSAVDWKSIISTVRTGKPNLVKPDGASHFGSQGEAYGFGLRGGYEKLTPSKKVSVGQYATKNISQDLSNMVTEAENICGAAIAEAVSTLDDKLPGFIRSITSPLRSIADCAKKNPHLEPLVRRQSTYGQEKKALYFQSFFLNVNAATQVLHSEKDCSYTMIYSPKEANVAGEDVRFEFAITTEHTLEILMEAGLVFCYSAYVLTHRQVIHSGNSFINLSAYGNKHYYDNSKRSIQRLLRRDTVPPFRLSCARIISNLPTELLESMALQAQALFSKRSKVQHITNSNLDQVRREGADKKDLFFIPQELDSIADQQHYREKQWKLLVQQVEDGLSDINAVLCEDVVPTFMQTRPEYKPPQNPHRDYSPTVLQKKQSPGRYPWIALIPLSIDGSYLFVWDAPGKPETLIHIPYGYMLFLRGDTVHAGGLPNELKAGPSYTRIHFYIPTALGDVDWDMTYADKDEEYYYHNL